SASSSRGITQKITLSVYEPWRHTPEGPLKPRDVRHDPAVVAEPRVPAGEGAFELGRIVAPLFEAHRIVRLRRDAVLVPGDVPGDGDHDLRIDAREDDDRDTRSAERLRDPADRAAVLGRVEEIGGLDHRELLLGEAPEDRVRRDRLLHRPWPRAHDRAEDAAAAPPPLRRNGRRRRRTLADPAVLDRGLG